MNIFILVICDRHDLRHRIPEKRYHCSSAKTTREPNSYRTTDGSTKVPNSSGCGSTTKNGCRKSYCCDGLCAPRYYNCSSTNLSNYCLLMSVCGFESSMVSKPNSMTKKVDATN